MSGFEKLSRDELLALLKNMEEPEGEKTNCLYVPVRGPDRARCKNIANTEWGFCDKHKKTVQSKKAKQNYLDDMTRKEDSVNAEKLVRESEKEMFMKAEAKKLASIEAENSRLEEEKAANEQARLEAENARLEEEKAAEEQARLEAENSRLEEEKAAEEQARLEEENVRLEEEKQARMGEKKMTRERFRFDEESESGESSYEGSDFDEESDDEEPIKLTVVYNKWKNFVHEDTGIVFDLDENCAIGLQKSNGECIPLSRKAIRICTENSWPYKIPEDYDDY